MVQGRQLGVQRGRRRQSNQRENRAALRGAERILVIPSYRWNPVVSRKFRFETSSLTEVSVTISNTDLSNLILSLAATGTSAQRLIHNFQLERVDVWVMGGVTTTTAAMLEWTGGGDPSTGTGTVAGGQNGHLSMKPPIDSEAHSWHRAGDTTISLLDINGSPGSQENVVIDIWLKFNTQAGFSSVATVASTAAGVYYTALDNTQATPVILPFVPGGGGLTTQVS